jgi:hypothetical protein
MCWTSCRSRTAGGSSCRKSQPRCSPCSSRQTSQKATLAPVICRRHRRWLGIPTTPGQFDLSNTPEIITANRRRDRLFRSQENQQWTDTQFRVAEWVTTGWSGIVNPLPHRHLTERWKQRSASITTATGRKPPAQLAMLPETVVLAEIFCDAEWRRQIATASHYGQRNFYLHIAHRLGLPLWIGPNNLTLLVCKCQ